MLVKISGIVLFCVIMWSLDPVLAETNSKILGCHKRDYTFIASKTSLDGKTCWDYVRAKSCWGRCDSLEIPDWRFPYKLSYHPVCMHEHTEVRRILLRYCNEDVPEELRYYQYIEAITCSCHLCNSSSASCEAPHHKKQLTKISTTSSSSYFPKNMTHIQESFLISD